MTEIRHTGTRRARVPLLLLAPLLLLVALGSWAVASPVGGAPDENYHIASIWCGAGDRPGLCETAPDGSGQRVPWATIASQCYAFHPEITANCQKKVLGSDPNHLVTTDHVNSTAHFYSPVYYAVMSVFASSDVAVSVIAVRLLNALIFVAIVTVLYLLLPARRRPLLVVPMAATLIPWGLFLVASVNPSGWAVLAGGTLWLAMLGFLETSGRRRIGLGVLAALITVMGAGARPDMAVYAVVALAAAVLIAARDPRGRRFWLSIIYPAALSVLCFLLYLTAQQATAWQNGSAPGSGGGTLHGRELLLRNLLDVPLLWFGSFGTWPLGWNDVVMPAVVWVGVMVVVGAVVFMGLATMGWRKAVLLAIGAVALIVLPVYLLQRNDMEVGALVHPRYLLPLVTMFVGFAMLPVSRKKLRAVTRVQAYGIVAILSVANAVALYSNIKRYTLGNATGLRLSAAGSWWWEAGVPHPLIVWLVGSAAFLAVLVLLARELLRHQTALQGKLSGTASLGENVPSGQESPPRGLANTQ